MGSTVTTRSWVTLLTLCVELVAPSLPTMMLYPPFFSLQHGAIIRLFQLSSCSSACVWIPLVATQYKDRKSLEPQFVAMLALKNWITLAQVARRLHLV